MKNADNNTDKQFKNAFEQFKVTPPRHNWEEIEETMDTQFDKEFKHNLKPLTVKPKAHNWTSIQKEIPLHPGAKRYIGWMTKVAAVLVIGMLLCILADQQKQIQIAAEQTPSSIPTIDENILSKLEATQQENTEFVYEVEEISPSRKSPRKNRKKTEEAELKNLLKFILDDDEDLAEVADTEVIKESLKPIEAPEDAIALARLEKEIEASTDLEINIPLIVVETEQEAANLIKIYDSSQKNNTQVD